MEGGKTGGLAKEETEEPDELDNIEELCMGSSGGSAVWRDRTDGGGSAGRWDCLDGGPRLDFLDEDA